MYPADSDISPKFEYQPPATAVLGSVRSLTEQKSGEEADGFKGLVGENITFPSRLIGGP